MIKEKLKAPNFKLPSTDNTEFELSKHLGKNINLNLNYYQILKVKLLKNIMLGE